VKRKFFLIKYSIFVFLFALTSCFVFSPAFKGEAVTPTIPAPDINLMDQNGQAFKLSENRGKVVLVFFGFTNCVDECPLTMAHIKQALDIVGDGRKNVQVVLITTDPTRDTPQALQAYLAQFDKAYTGIPGSWDDLSKVWKDYGVEVLDGGETHSSFTYVIDKAGSLRLRFEPETNPEDIAFDLKTLLAEN
jgi:protein SCO1